MFTNLDRYVKILEELNITANQFLLCYLLFADEKNEKGEYPKKGKAIANLYRYAGSTPWTKEEIRDLEEKGYVTDPYADKNKTNPDLLDLTDKFKEFVLIQGSHFDELYKTFPTLIDNFRNPNGPKIKLKVCDKYELKKLYKKRVRSKVKHKRVMEILKWAIENDEINFNFENFIKGEMWEDLEEVKEGKKDSISSNMSAAR